GLLGDSCRRLRFRRFAVRDGIGFRRPIAAYSDGGGREFVIEAKFAEATPSHPPSDRRHSCRRATIGSTLVARRAGMYEAARDTSVRSKATATKVMGSVGRT